MMIQLRPSEKAWIGLVIYIIVIDTFLIRKKIINGAPYCSMSETFGQTLKHPTKRWPLTLGWFFLTLHLFEEIIPEKFEFLKKIDPLRWIINKFSKGEA